MPVSERSYADLMRANAALGRRLRDAEGQATLFRGAVKRRNAEVERLREKLAEMELHEDLPDSFDMGYMAAWREMNDALNAS